MAMEKLGQLRARNEWDLIVVDTPPSRSALDFLDAPARLSRFLDGRMLRMLLAPARAGGRSMFRLASASFGLFTRAVTKILGTQLLTDLSTFVAALDSMFGGFRERAERTYRILQDRETAFLVVAVPEPDAVREAAYFAGRLDTERMPLAGLVLNRVSTVEAPAIAAGRARAAAVRLDEMDGQDVTADTLRIHAGLVEQSARQAAVTARFVSAYPQVPVVEVPAQPADVHDLDGLRAIGRALATTEG
jgi:anion-transporting  ArsA/GET3 family ATPase